MSFKAKPQQIFKTVLEFFPCSNQNSFFRSIFICIGNGWHRMFSYYDLFTHRKVTLSDPLNIKVGTNLRAGSPLLQKCLVRHSKSYSQEQAVCSRDSRLTHSSCLIFSLVPGPSLTWKTLLAPHSSSGIVLFQQQAWAAKLDSVLLSLISNSQGGEDEIML